MVTIGNMSNNSIDYYIQITNSEWFLSKAGSDYFIDSIIFFILSPLEVFGAIFNLFSLAVFYKMNKNSTFLFKMLQIYCFNSFLMCFLSIPTSYAYAPRYLGFKFDIFARIFVCWILNYVGTTLYFVCNILDLVIAMDRLAIFDVRFKKFSGKKPLLIYGIVIVSCSLINLPTFFRNRIMNDSEALDNLIFNIDTSSFRVILCAPGLLYNNFPSLVFNLVLRDILTLFLEIAISSLTIHYFIKFQAKKAEMHRINLGVAQNKDKNKSKKEKEDSKLTHMILYMTLLSITTHLGLFICYAGQVNKPNIFTVNYLVVFAGLSTTIKNVSNIVIFYFFNVKFKARFWAIFKRNNSDRNSSNLG